MCSYSAGLLMVLIDVVQKARVYSQMHAMRLRTYTSRYWCHPNTFQEGILDDMLEADFELGCIFKDKLIPHAALWFTGEAIDFDDDDYGFDGFDEFDDEDGSDDEDDDEDDDDDEEDERPKKALPPAKKGGAGGRGGQAPAPKAGGAPGQPQQPECKQQ